MITKKLVLDGKGYLSVSLVIGQALLGTGKLVTIL
jgi:hypothetical protein